MKKSFLIVAAIAALFFSGYARAANDQAATPGKAEAAQSSDASNYASFKLGYVLGDAGGGLDSVDGFGGQVAFGVKYYVWLFDLRGELELGYYNQSQNESGIETRISPRTVMANIYADLGKKDWKTAPYIGFGIGYANVSIKSSYFGSSSDNKNGFSWGAYAGLTFEIFASLKGDLAFRFNQVDMNGETLDNLGGTIGLQYSF